jgi:hypothetical protein
MTVAVGRFGGFSQQQAEFGTPALPGVSTEPLDDDTRRLRCRESLGNYSYRLYAKPRSLGSWSARSAGAAIPCDGIEQFPKLTM